jgi:drug/metabolite transporter (DMT)-like permease
VATAGSRCAADATGKPFGLFAVDVTSVIEKRVPPLAALAVAVLAVSTSAILVRWSVAPSLVKAFYRVLFTTAILLPFAFGRYRTQFAHLSRSDLLVAVVSGAALALHFSSWFESLNHTTVAASVTLVQSQPLFVTVGAWALLDERVSGRTVAGIGVALAGMLVMSFGDVLASVEGGLLSASLPQVAAAVGGGEAALYGNGLAVVGAVMAAAYVLAGRSLRQRVALIPYVTVVYGVCTVVLLGFTVSEGHALLGYPRREWALFLGMAVGPGIFGHTVVNWALAHLESSVVSVSLLGEPLGSTLLALALLGEIPSAATVVGGAVVLGGIYVTASARSDGAGGESTPGDDAESIGGD